MSFWDFRGRDADEVREFLETIYADNEFKIFGQRGSGKTRIYGEDVGDIAQYNVSYSSPFRFSSETSRETYLILSCTGGSATSHQQQNSIELTPGIVAPISATRPSLIESHGDLAHISTHIDVDFVQDVCSQLLGYSVDEKVIFDHHPFSDEMKYQWGLVVNSLNRLLNADVPSEIAIDSAKTHAVALLLSHHPHNFSDHLMQPVTFNEAAIKAAKDFADRNVDGRISLADMAKFAGCSIRALHRGFCEIFGVAPKEYLRLRRIEQLRAGHPAFDRIRLDDDASIALGSLVFGDQVEKDTDGHLQTILRGHSDAQSKLIGGGLTQMKIEFLRHHINVNLGNKLSVGQLAAAVAMSPQSFAVAFKRVFKTTPAQYVLTERLKWAHQLLANSNMSIATVASETGFSSQSHLTSAIKHMSGRTPAEIRRAWHYVGMPKKADGS